MIAVAATTAFALGVLLGLYTTPLMREAALKFGIVDHPDGALKTHREPVAYLGGLAVFLAFLITLGIVFEFSHNVLGLLLGGTIVLLVGLIDDLGVLSPREKLAGEALAVAVLLKAGIHVKLVFLWPGADFLISILWLLAMTNAFNLIDIMDGLAGGVAAIAAGFLAAAAIWNGDPLVATMAAALAGSLVGFLTFNFEPARIYLGDAGSLFLGFTLGALGMLGQYTERSTLGSLTPAVILGVPLFDMAFVSVIRLRKGLSPFRGSPDHFALRLRRTGLSVRQTVLLAYIAGGTLGIGGLALMRAPDATTASILLAALSAATLVTAAIFSRTGGR